MTGRARPNDPLRAICEIPGCRNRASERHHKLRRSQGGDDSKDNTLDVCKWHHDEIHAWPAWAYENDYLRRGGYCPTCGLSAGHWKGCEG